MEIDSTVLIAFGLTLLAGLSTGIGSALAFFTKRTNFKFLCISLGFSAGVMIFVSFVEMLPAGEGILDDFFSPSQAAWYTVFSFFAGIVFIGIIDHLIPSHENPHEVRTIQDVEEAHQKPVGKKLMRLGIFTALAVAIHNFPEGLVTFTGALQDVSLGISLAVAIAIHNIPEGIAVSVPLYYATGSRKRAFSLSFLSGLAEPLGAILGFYILHFVGGESILGFSYAFVAGIMVYISLDELLPAARRYGQHHLSIYGLIAGMFIMAVSLLLF